MKPAQTRLSVNLLSLLLTIFVLFFAVSVSDGGESFAKKINKITANLDKAVLTLSNYVSYTNFTDNLVYVSDTNFKPGGMAGLYNLTNQFIDVFAPDDILMPGLISIDGNNNINLKKPDVSRVFSYYAHLVAIIIFLVLCTVLFPLCWLFFCCCRCCGNCGAKPLPSNKKKDTCKKVIYATLLIACTTGLLFCIVCAFSSNQQLQEGIDTFPKNINNSIKDTKTFMESTDRHVRNLLVKNYGEFTDAFEGVMGNSSQIAMQQLKEYSNATAVSEIRNFANNITSINATLLTMKRDTNQLRVYASQLNDALRKVRRDLTLSLQECAERNVPGCREIKAKVDQLQTTIDFNSVPDLTETYSSLNDLSLRDITEAANSASEQIDKISKKIEEYLDDALTHAKSQIETSRTVIEENLQTVSDTIDQIKSQLDGTAKPLNTVQSYINEYGRYRLYGGLAISCVLLLVAVCLIFGLICGVCGKRPDGYGDNCCNKGAGGQFLICAVYIMLFFGFIISLLTVIALITGVLTEKAVCDPLRNPDPYQYTVIRLLDEVNVDLGVDAEPSQILKNCYQNKSLYQTFGLKSKFDLDEIRQQFNIADELAKLNISNALNQANFKLISEEQLSDLEKLLQFEPKIDVDKFSDELDKNLTNYSLDELSQNLKSILVALDSYNMDDLKNSIQLSLIHVETYNEKFVVPLRALAKNLVDTAIQLDVQLKMNQTSFSAAIELLIEEIKEANVSLTVNATQSLSKTTEAFKTVILDLVDGYLNRVVVEIQEEIGQCGPLNLVIHSGITSTCERVLWPWNGFWFTLFWTIIIYILAIVISVKLANLYSRHKPYDQYVETRSKRPKRKGKKPKRFEERAPPRDGGVAREHAQGSHAPPDVRYADMAPKHWEQLPNGGPPHYQRAPTEYERPPPYYFPGSAGEQ